MGSSLSITVIVKLQTAVLPKASVTVYSSEDVPTGKIEPLPTPPVWRVIAPGQLSVPVGEE